MKLAPRTKVDLALASAIAGRCSLKAATAKADIEDDPENACGQLSFLVSLAQQLSDLAADILADLDKANGRV